MSRIFISETITKGTDAGNKARNDMEVIFKDIMKYTPLYLYKNKQKRGGINRIIYIYDFYNEVLKKTNIDNLICVQYPLQTGYNWFIPYLTKHRKILFLIHDLNDLREENYSKEEIKRFFNAAYVISHNECMSRYLIEQGVDSNKIVNLELFDYLVKTTISNNHSNDESFVCYAGNLSKSKFIYSLPSNLTQLGFNVYGNFFDEERGHELIYKGCFDSEVIHEKLEGKFGLVWDGESCLTCKGPLGNYMKYNNPHKLSMYMAACMPVIVWNKSAVSKFVKENEIGFSVNSLDEIVDIYKHVTPEIYNKLIENVKKIQVKVNNAEFVKNALDKCI